MDPRFELLELNVFAGESGRSPAVAMGFSSTGGRPRLLQNTKIIRLRAEGPTVNRPGRQAGIAIRQKMSAESAALS
jgi:hypothetical protein